MARVGKYKSRRTSRPRKGGGIVPDIVHEAAAKAVEVADKAVHHTHQHEPQEVVKAVQKHITEAPDVAKRLLDEHVMSLPKSSRPILQPFTYSFADPHVDPFAHAQRIRKQFVDARPNKKHYGGALDFKSVFSKTKEIAQGFNPADSAGKAIESFNKINLNDPTPKGVAHNALHAYAGNMRAHAAYA